MFREYSMALLLLFACTACQPQETGDDVEEPSTTAESEESQETIAAADLAPKSGSGLSGRAVFKKSNGEVRFEVELNGLEQGPHAIHIHETGDCGAEDASSAGGHWNPTNDEHGKWGEPPFHLGDIGNVEVGENGKGSLTMTTDLWSIGDSSDRDVVGKAIVVHSGADDFESQPSGAAGGRIGCGVIEMEAQGGEM